jgi:type I restriction enzyme M protein
MGNVKATTTAQSLGSLIKSARDIMRKDKGLNGDLDRLPMLTWIMFLKFLDDLELQREAEAELGGKNLSARLIPRIVGEIGQRSRKESRAMN